MNPSGRGRGVLFLFRKRILSAAFLAILCALLTGCPHNDYTVELKPKANGVERTLIFYRADGSNTNQVPNYPAFASNELVSITAVYPPAAVKQEGWRYSARGEFAGALPQDVGGAGSYSNFSTSLGSTGYYVERFRGNDDLAGQTEKRFHAADQIADLVIGWTQSQFGQERGYKKLHKFLDEDVRNDLKNAGLYFWTAQIGSLSDTNAAAEFIVRFGQYLHERGYLKLADLPKWYAAVEGDDYSAIMNLIQQLIAEKMEIPASGPTPKSFVILNNPAAFENSWTNYLAGTESYRARLRAWETKRNTDPKLKPPEPSQVFNDLAQNLLQPLKLFGGTPDHLTVKLTLDRPPNHSNGQWCNGQVVWTADLDEDRPLPVLCYASWTDPNAEFQRTHFGRVILDGDELTEYCVWQSSLDPTRASEWESFLASLQPQEKIQERLKVFRFGTEPLQATTNQATIGCQLLVEAFSNSTNAISGRSK